MSFRQDPGVLPSTEEEDPTYDRNLNWSNPVKYIIQKWICKRKKSMRYKTDDTFFEDFDGRRLVDARFLTFMGILGNLLFQTQALLNPIPGTR